MTHGAEPSAPALEPLLTTEEVAQILRVDAKTVRALVAESDLPAIRLGKRCIRFDPRDLAAFIEAAKKRASSPSAPAARVTVRVGKSAWSGLPWSQRDDVRPVGERRKGRKT